MIGNWNNSGVLFAALPTVLGRGTAPDQAYQGVHPLYLVSGVLTGYTTAGGYSGLYLNGDGSGYLQSDYALTLSPTSVFTAEATINYGTIGTYFCGEFEDANNYWYGKTTTGSGVEFVVTVDGATSTVLTDPELLTLGSTHTIFLQKDALDLAIFIGSGEAVYDTQEAYPVDTGVYTVGITLGNHATLNGTSDQICKFVTYDKVLTDAEKLWNTNNCSYSGLIGIASGVHYLDVKDPAYAITSPNGGNVWKAGASKTITWDSSWVTYALTGYVKIEYSINAGTSWTTIVASTLDTGSYVWTTPVGTTKQTMIKVTQVSESTPSDASDAVFTVQLQATPVSARAKRQDFYRDYLKGGVRGFIS